VSLTESSDSVVLSGGGYKVLGALLFSFIGLVGGIPPLVSDRVFAQVFGGVLLAGMGVVLVRWIRAAIYADSTHLVLRTPFRTTRLE
jgi:hypothetical protein